MDKLFTPLNVGVAVAVAIAAFVVPKFMGRSDSRRKPGVTGPKATEGLVTSEEIENDYDGTLRKLWGGPPPKHFQAAMATWKTKYGDLKGKTAIVTGGGAGIGFYITKLLAEMGCRVVVPSRKGLEYETKSAKDAIIKACPSAKIVISEIPLDLASFSSVREFAQSLKSLEAIDFLCLNAGRGGSKGDPRETTAADGYESIMQVNAVSHFLLTAELMPLLKAAKDGARVVSQSSGARQIWTTGSDVPQRMLNDLSGEKIPADKYDAFTQYELSKAANCFFTMGLNKRLATAGIDNIIALATDPGFSCTGVNIQHNLGHSLLKAPDGVLPTCTMHDVAGHHAADGALNQVLACVHPDATRDGFFSPRDDMVGPPTLRTQESLRKHPKGRNDPMMIPAKDGESSHWGDRDALTEAFWAQAMEATVAKWDF